MWGQELEVQVLCHMEQQQQPGVAFKSIFSAVISNIFGISSSLWGGSHRQGWVKGSPCPPGFSNLPSGCFLFSPLFAKSQQEAEEICLARQASLARQEEGSWTELGTYWQQQWPGCAEEAWWWMEAG